MDETCTQLPFHTRRQPSWKPGGRGDAEDEAGGCDAMPALEAPLLCRAAGGARLSGPVLIILCSSRV